MTTKLVLFILFVFSSSISRSDYSSIERREQKIRFYEIQKKNVISSLGTINQRMKRLSRERGHLSDNKMDLDGKIRKLAQSIVQLEELMAVQKMQLRVKLVSMYSLSGESYVKVLLNSKSPDQMDRQIKFLSLLMNKNLKVLAVYKKNYKIYQAEKMNLIEQLQRLSIVEKSLLAKEDALKKEQSQKMTLVKSLDTDREKVIAELRDLKQKAMEGLSDEAFQKDFKEFMGVAFYEMQGHLPVPVLGQVKHRFGLVKDPELMTEIAHKGWWIESAPHSRVQNVFPGKVVWVSGIEGLGITVIVDNGHNYYTVYSHLGESSVDTGQQLIKGDTIGSTGAKSYYLGQGIHFQIRYFSESLDPAKWIEKSSMTVTKNNSSDNDVKGNL